MPQQWHRVLEPSVTRSVAIETKAGSSVKVKPAMTTSAPPHISHLIAPCIVLGRCGVDQIHSPACLGQKPEIRERPGAARGQCDQFALREVIEARNVEHRAKIQVAV